MTDNPFGLSPRSLARRRTPERQRQDYAAKYGRIMDPANRESFVYMVFAENGDCLYIGRSVKPEQRWRSHVGNVKAAWTSEAASFRKTGPYNHETAVALERELIELHQPLHNRMFTIAHGWTPKAKGKSA